MSEYAHSRHLNGMRQEIEGDMSSSDSLVVIRAGQVITPFRTIERGCVLVRGGRIDALGPWDSIPIPEAAEIVDVQDKIVAPGFIDTHIHGWCGARFHTTENVHAAAQAIARNGTTGFLPTLGGEPDVEELMEQIRASRRAMQQDTGGAAVLGIHMEGPYLSDAPTARGSQRVDAVRRPSVAELNRMVEAAEGHIRKMSIAPELDGAIDVIREMARLDIVPSAAHTAATYEQIMDAVDAGLRCATHTFNGMMPMHHRQPGLVAAILTCDDIIGELIADGVHVSAPVMRALLRCKGTDRVHLVTDNGELTGQPDGVYERPEGRRVIKQGNKAVVEGGTLAGSVVTLNVDVHNIVAQVGYSLPQAIKMASTVPANLCGFGYRKGEVAVGKDADLIVIDQDVNVYLTMVGGRIVYRAGGA